MARTPMKLLVDDDTIEKLASIHCTMEEIATIAGCSKDTIERRPELMEKIERARADGKASLRRHQWTLAQKGNATLLIWLGKQLLGQKDISRIELHDVPDEVFKAEVERRLSLVQNK